MSRPVGKRNHDFNEKRAALVNTITDFVLSEGVDSPSFRQIAIAADTSEPTLRHYFGDRSGVLVAVFKHIRDLSIPLKELTSQPAETFDDSVETYIDLVAGYRKNTRYIRGHGFGIRESMNDEAAREAYLKYMLQPAVDAVAERLVRSPGGPKNYPTAKMMGFMLVASSIVVILHQELLNGKTYAPLDVDEYFEQLKKWMKGGIGSSLNALDKKS